MATILDKDITRESTVKYDDREIQVTLTADQQISFKLKGMKSGILSIKIEDLYKQLAGAEEDVEDVKPTAKGVSKPVSFLNKKRDGEYNGGPLIPLNRLRSLNLVSILKADTKLELEKLISELIKQEINL